MASSVAVTFFFFFLLADFPRNSNSFSDFGLVNTMNTTKGKKSLEKRSLVTFPPDSLFQINMGITLSSEVEKNSAVVVLAFQQNAPLPNETLSSTVVSGRQFSIYHHLRDVITRYGFNGADCLRKMICEIGESPLFGGLVEDIVTFVFTPSRHRSIQYEKTNPQREEQSFWNSLLDAEQLGKEGKNCSSAFPLCVRTPLDLVSSFIQI